MISTWDQLPTAVLAQIFLAVCKHGALPMAPRLACVCTNWTAAVTATPELWRLIDTAAIPNRAWGQHPSSARSPPGKSKGAGTKRAGKAVGKQRLLSAEQGLSQWVASGRLQQLQALLLYGEGGSGLGCADPQDGAGRDANRQLSAVLLMQIADSCQQLQRVSLFGAWSLRSEVRKPCRAQLLFFTAQGEDDFSADRLQVLLRAADLLPQPAVLGACACLLVLVACHCVVCLLMTVRASKVLTQLCTWVATVLPAGGVQCAAVHAGPV